MARPKTPQGKRVTICIKVSEEQAALIDAARGNRDRSEWGRDALLFAAGQGPRPAAVILTATASAASDRATLAGPGALSAPAQILTRPAHKSTCKCLTCKPEGGK